MKARARHTDPETSRVAAAKASKGLKVTQQAVLIILRMAGRPLLDEELIPYYRVWQLSMNLPGQSDSGIRSRRSELSKMGLLEPGEKRRMSTGGTGMTWSVKASS
jgi:hypothetical protein